MQGLFRWSSKWWPGLIPLVAIWAIAAWTTTAPLESDLAARSSDALKDIVLNKSRIAVAGRDVTLAAEAFSEEGRSSAVAKVEAVAGVRLVNDETRLVPEAKPFVWTAERDVVRLTLSGNAPLPATRSKLTEAARATLGGVEVVDQMNLSRGAPPRFDAAALLLLEQVGKLKDGKITITDDKVSLSGMARGAPPRFDGAALLLLDQIGKLKDGKITLSDNKVSLSGMARDLGGREAIAAALKNLPEGFSVAANEVRAPPYVFQAYKDPVAVTLTLTGNVPDSNVQAAIVAAAGRKFFSEKVVDNLKPSVGAPSGFAGAVVPALGALSRLSTGTLVVSDREVKLTGDALYDSAPAQIRSNLLKDFPQGFQLKADISVKPAAAPVDANICQQLFSELLGKGTIRFESGRSTIDPDSLGLLDRLIETALRCPTVNVEVAGHTDAVGEASTNQALSEKRAQAVVDYLVKAGLPASRFNVVGYGSTQPVATNDTEQGKAQNRRIEFLVKE
jgi:OOP family OmpA-OmpF porin